MKVKNVIYIYINGINRRAGKAQRDPGKLKELNEGTVSHRPFFLFFRSTDREELLI